jgi:hypothetical protein
MTLSLPSVVAIVIGFAWLLWEWHSQRKSADSNKLFSADLFGRVTWVGAWFLEVPAQREPSTRAKILKTEAARTPRELVQALMKLGKPRVLAHVAGPTDLSKQQALEWVENVGPRLVKIALPDHVIARSNHQVFALAYVSDMRPPAQKNMARIIDHVAESWGSSLVCCARSAASAPSFTSFVRYGFAFAFVTILVLLIQKDLLPSRSAIEPVKATPTVPGVGRAGSAHGFVPSLPDTPPVPQPSPPPVDPATPTETVSAADNKEAAGTTPKHEETAKPPVAWKRDKPRSSPNKAEGLSEPRKTPEPSKVSESTKSAEPSKAPEKLKVKPGTEPLHPGSNGSPKPAPKPGEVKGSGQ